MYLRSRLNGDEEPPAPPSSGTTEPSVGKTVPEEDFVALASKYGLATEALCKLQVWRVSVVVRALQAGLPKGHGLCEWFERLARLAPDPLADESVTIKLLEWWERGGVMTELPELIEAAKRATRKR